MPRTLATVLTVLCDATASLGAGVADHNGLLIDARGLHDAHPPEAVAAHLAHSRKGALEALLDDHLDDHILLGKRYCFYLAWFSGARYFAYAMTRRELAKGSVRQALVAVVEELTVSFGAGSLAAQRQRLEQPRQFPRAPLIR